MSNMKMKKMKKDDKAIKLLVGQLHQIHILSTTSIYKADDKDDRDARDARDDRDDKDDRGAWRMMCASKVVQQAATIALLSTAHCQNLYTIELLLFASALDFCFTKRNVILDI